MKNKYSMIKNYNKFRTSVKNTNWSPINEEYSAKTSTIFWWVCKESNLNNKVKLDREDHLNNYDIEAPIEDIQFYLKQYKLFNSNVNGVWNEDTIEAIKKWKARWKFDWESGDGGDSICPSVLKTLVYNNKGNINKLSWAMQIVSQRPKILQEAYVNLSDPTHSWANDWATYYRKVLDKVREFQKIRWDHVNTMFEIDTAPGSDYSKFHNLVKFTGDKEPEGYDDFYTILKKCGQYKEEEMNIDASTDTPVIRKRWFLQATTLMNWIIEKDYDKLIALKR